MKNCFKYIIRGLSVALLLFVAGCEEDDDFTTVAVTVDQVSVESAFPGDPVSLTGTNFNTVQFIFVGNQQAPFQRDGNTINFTVPSGAAVGHNTITLAMPHNYRLSMPFEVLLRPTPVIERFDPFVAPGGELRIVGLSLDAEYGPMVTIDGVQANIVSNSPTELVVTVPNGIPDDEFLELAISSIHGETKATTAFLARGSLLANGDFHEGGGDDFSGWEKLNGADRMTAVTGAEAYGGGRSMLVQPASGNPWDNQFAADGVPLVLGEEYTLVLWARAVDPGAFFRFSISQFDGNGADYFYGEDKVLDATWQPYSWTFTVSNNLPLHRAVLDMGASTGAFMVDHIALVPGALSATGEKPEILANSGFEEGMTGWTVLNGSLEATTADFYCGAQSLTTTGVGGNPWSVQLASDPTVLEVGLQYELGFWAKAAASTEEDPAIMRASVSQFASGQSDDFFYTPDLEVATQWTYYTYVFEAAATSTGDHRVVLDFGVSQQSFFLDNISLKEYAPAPSLYTGGDFEDGLMGWQILNGTAEPSTDAFQGSGSLTATGTGGNPWDVQLATDPAVSLEVGSDYRLSFWAKAPAATAEAPAVMRASVSRFASGQSDDFFYSPDIEVATEWTHYAFVFEAQATSTGDHFIVLDFGSTTQTFFVDDVILHKVDLECE